MHQIFQHRSQCDLFVQRNTLPHVHYSQNLLSFKNELVKSTPKQKKVNFEVQIKSNGHNLFPGSSDAAMYLRLKNREAT